ncbi:FAD-dependent monooxygenase [Pseudomonas sp. S2_E01]
MRILIVGGGIAGFAMARALELKGFTPELVERRLDESPGGMGFYLPGNAGRALARLGLLDSVRRAAALIKTQRIMDQRGRLLTVTDTEDFWRDCGPCLSLPRDALHTILRGALERTNTRFGVSITGITPATDACEVAFSDHTTATYDLVIGADGIDSTVRRMIFPAIQPSFVGNVCWRFITQNTTGIEGWTAMLGKGRTLLAIPVSGEQVYVYADMAVAEDEFDRVRHASLQSLFGDFAGPLFPLLADTRQDTHFGSIQQVVMPHWYRGRAVLIGDAAHASSPSMAEGAGMAIEDAWVMADAIATHQDLDAALQAYSARRQPRVDWVQKQCVARDKMRTLPVPARNLILKLLGDKLYKRSYMPLLASV